MSRPLRIEYPGALYHVMNRGNRRERVFRTKADHALFLERLERFAGEFGVELLTYCLMPNHFHLFLRTRQANLSRFMQSLLTSFTVFVNRRDKTSGHIFQGRFKAQLVEGEGYFDTLSRYIHLNPVRVQAIKNLPVEERRRMLAEFSWSSFPALIGVVKTPDWLKAEDVLKRFGSTPRDQMKAYRLYVEEGLMKDVEDPAEAVRVRSILGSDAFADWVKREWLLKTPVKDRREQQELARLQGEIPVQAVVNAVASTCDVPARSLCRRGCRNREARQLAILVASRHCRGSVSIRELARAFGLSPNGFTLAADRTAKRLEKKPASRKQQQAILTALRLPSS